MAYKQDRCKWNRTLTMTFVAALILITTWNQQVRGTAKEGDGFDAGPFGMSIHDADNNHYGIRWAEPRKIRRLVVDFEKGAVPDPSAVRIQYWHCVWDGKADPVPAEHGAGGVGWDAMDDWTNGKWKDAETRLSVDNGRWIVTFEPTSDKEIKDFKGTGVTYRKTLQIRIASNRPIPAPRRIAAYTDSNYRSMNVRIQFGPPRNPAVKVDAEERARLEVFNGEVVNVSRHAESSTEVGSDRSWSVGAGGKGGIEAVVMMAVDPMDGRYDRTVVTVRSSQRPFSFAADEIARGDRILVDDLGVLVTRAEDTISLADYRQALSQEFSGQTVYDRVHREKEQTLDRAWNDMPLKRPLYFVHGLPGNRNSMHQHPNGDLDVSSSSRWFSLHRSARDSDRKLWEGESLELSFGFPAERLRGGRELAEGYLPLLRTWWQDDSLFYEQKTVLDTLDGDLDDIQLDTPTVLLMQVRVVNTSEAQTGQAILKFRSRAAQDGKLVIENGQAIARTDKGPRVRFLIQTDGKGHIVQDGQASNWSQELKPGESATVDIQVPSITLTGAEEIRNLEKRRFENAARRACDFWRNLTARGAQIQTPEPWLNDFYKAHLRHMLVNCMKEPDSDLLHAHVGTFSYGVYPNESAMMISDLDRRGYHEEARRNLDAFLHYQGSVGMPGNFRMKDGQFYGAGGHETGGYNKSHGYVLWNMGEHWWNTRDRQWMEQAAPKLVKSLDWVTVERHANLNLNADGSKPIEYGWLPTGSLEDVTDYWHWLSTNSATVWGFLNLADALADSGNPDGARLQSDAKAYRDEFLRGINESRVLCPVVRLRDATYVPKVPSRLYERGRSHGWLRETLEGSIFLPAYNLIPPDSPETLWILKDFEDNLYISDRYGYAIPVFDQYWYSRGGFSMQANLLDGPLPYLWRDDIKHYIRAFFNGFASAFYPEIRMCNEHSLPELGCPAGDHFKSSDEAQVTYWLRLMFVNERGKDLYLGQAIPRYWMADGKRAGIERSASRYGPLSFSVESHAASGEIKASVEPPQRNPPDTIYVRIRHPEAKPIHGVILNGREYQRYDTPKEWVILPGNIQGRQEIVIKY